MKEESRIKSITRNYRVIYRREGWPQQQISATRLKVENQAAVFLLEDDDKTRVVAVINIDTVAEILEVT